MKSKRAGLLSGYTRSRLFLTLGLAVVLPALTLIYVNFHHVKSIQRDKKVEGLIHRDFQYILSVTEKKLREKTYTLIEQARDQFPNDGDTEQDTRKKLKALLAQSPWFAYVFIYDVDKGENKLILESQPKISETERGRISEMYGGWFGMEGRQMVDLTNRRTKRMFWYSGETETAAGPTYVTTAFFTFPYLPKDRPVLGGASLDTTYLKENFLPAILDETIATKLSYKQEGSVASMLHELTPEDVDQSHPDKRLTMMVYLADAGSGRGYRPFAASPTWGSGKPEVSQNLDDPFRGLSLGIKFQGTTAEAISRNWVFQSFLILGVLSVLMIGGLVLTYRSVNKQVALARLKSDFVSNVSHELRTPLALIRLYAETLELGRITTTEKKHEYYSIIRKESERLTALINNILDFSRIEAGRKEYDFRETDIAELVRNTLDSYRFQIEQQGFVLEERIEPGIPKVRVDREAIARALVNLVNNALKYSDSEKFLGVKLYREKSVLKLEVIDRGIGIDRHEQARIFEKFYRTCDPLVHNTKGSGLGLSLVRHITHAHGGEVEVESTPGRGSKFTLRLPLAGAAQAGATQTATPSTSGAA
ncbi:MAG TPA: HAMP domain-containing sensor histidine kinase [Pyrinomonadaceae bacterium]|jgi:signal transduction histidine kinase|nr:HAMP domain-containing sensor histidine kinase [Pyrinomonadaceae bacterium]